MSPEQEKQCREAFEARVSPLYDLSRWKGLGCRNAKYNSDSTQIAWEHFQAGAAWSAAQAGQDLDAKKLIKMLSPLSSLVGAARSASGISADDNLPEWSAGIVAYANRGGEALDALMDYLCDRLPAPPTQPSGGEAP